MEKAGPPWHAGSPAELPLLGQAQGHPCTPYVPDGKPARPLPAFR